MRFLAAGVVQVVAVVLVLTPSLSGGAEGQAPALKPGTPIRVTVGCPAATVASRTPECRLAGTLVGLPADSIAVAMAGSTRRYPLSAVTRLEVSRGKRSQWLLGAGVGFFAGTGITFVVLESGGSTSWCDQSANQDAIGETECLGLTVLGGAVGAGLGAIIGGMFRGERWQDVPVDRIRISLAPRRGLQFGLVMSF